MNANSQILYKELSYKLMSLVFSVHNQLGSNLQEKQYQKAIEQLLKEEHIPFKKELPATLTFHNSSIGHYFLDFLIDNSIVLELKTKPILEASDIRQVLTYLKTTGLSLGILVNFRTKRVTYRRIINSIRDHSR